MFVLLQRLCRVYVVWNCSGGGGHKAHFGSSMQVSRNMELVIFSQSPSICGGGRVFICYDGFRFSTDGGGQQGVLEDKTKEEEPGLGSGGERKGGGGGWTTVPRVALMASQ